MHEYEMKRAKRLNVHNELLIRSLRLEKAVRISKGPGGCNTAKALYSDIGSGVGALEP